MTIISQENLLGYVNGNKLGHDNSQKSNTFLSYYKDNWYGHEYKQPPTPPTPTTITMSFDNSSQYLAEPIPSITLSSEDTNTMMVDSGTNALGIFVDGTIQYTIDPELVDEWCNLIGWEDNTLNILTPGVTYTITSDIVLIPMIQRQVIHRDTQGPCPDGFHIGTKDEWGAVKDAMTTLGLWNKTDFMNCLKTPSAYYLNRSNGAKNTSYGPVRFWSSTMTANNVAWCVGVDEKDAVIYQEDKPGNAFSIRPFKDTAVDPFDGTGPVPDEPGIGWTTIVRFVDSYDGIYWNQTKGIITIRRGSYLYTISDKNLGATNVWDNGTYYQFGNNYGFSPSPSNYRTSKVTTDMIPYGPGNYYNNSKYVRVSSGNNWFTSTNNNLWGGVTNGTWTDPV